jgi:hypothetical protein
MKRLILAVVITFLMSAPTVLAQDFCKGDHDYDGDCDSDDVTSFLEDFGRSQFNNPCPPDGPAPVEKTGQTTPYEPRDDGDLEKGVAWPNPRFNDRGNGTVVDNLTGLTWLKNANCFGTRTWNNALSDCHGLSDGFCGLSDDSSAFDWRLPNRFELESLLTLKYSDPVVPNTAGTGKWSEGNPFNSVISSNYWSSTTDAYNSGGAWVVGMDFGDVIYGFKGNDNFVWPVRGGH